MSGKMEMFFSRLKQRAEVRGILADVNKYIKENLVVEERRNTIKFNAAMAKKPRQEFCCAEMAMSAANTLEEAIKNIGEGFSARLLRFIDESGRPPAEIYKKANIDRKLFSKIQCDPEYKPRKKTVIAFALALELNIDDTKDLLASAGYALSPASVFDLIIEYFVVHGIYDIYTVNLALYEHDQPLLE